MKCFLVKKLTTTPKFGKNKTKQKKIQSRLKSVSQKCFGKNIFCKVTNPYCLDREV